MAVNETKVTITADDEATEVIRRLNAAIKQLEKQQGGSNNAFRDSKRAAEGATSAFSSFEKAIGKVAVALGAIRVIDFVRDTIEAADQIGKLAQKTGASTEALSVLAVAASTADLSQESLGNSLKFLARSFTELQAGVPQTVEAFAALGLSAKDLKGLSLDQVIVKIANAQDRFADGAGKTATLLKIFGRNGEEIIPLLHDLANGGFDQAAQKANDLGLVVGTDATNAARDFDDAMATLKGSLKGVVITLTPLIKQMADLTDAIANFVSQHQNIVGVAAALSVLAGGIAAVTTALAAFKAIGAAGLLARFLAFLTGGPIGVAIGVLLTLAAAFGIVKSHIDAVNEAASVAAKKNLDQLIADVGLKDKPKPDVNLGDAAQRKALLDAQLAATKQGLQSELAATQSAIKRREELNNEAFARGVESLQAFYAKRITLTQEAVKAETDELKAERDALQSPPKGETQAEQVKRQSEIKAITAQIAKIEVDGKTQVLALIEQQRVAEKALAQELQGFQQQILTAQGNIIAADKVKIAQSVETFKLALTKAAGGAGKITADVAEEINNLAAAFSTLLTNQAAFAQAQRQSSIQLNELDVARAQIRAKAAAGLISERQADLDIIATEKDRLPALQKAADLMQFFGEQLNNPEMKIAAAQLKAEIAGLGQNLSESAKDIVNLRDNLLDAGRSGLGTFLGSTISQVKSVGEAFASLVLSISQGFQQVLGKLIADKAIDSLRNLFGDTGNVQKPVIELGVSAAVVKAGALKMGESATKLGLAGGIVLKAAEAMGIAASALAAAAAAAAGTATLQTLGGLGIGIGGGLFASGGPVRGPGTSTSDSILARLSAGEYVLRADAVRKLGIPFLDALNGLRMSSLRRFSAGLPGFAMGGFVAGGGGSGGNFSGEIGVTVATDEGSVLKAFSTRGGFKATLKHVNQNPQAFRAALGIV